MYKVIKALFTTLIAVILVSGCATKVKQVYKLDQPLEKPKHVNVDVGAMKEVNVALGGPGYDGNQVADAMYQSAQTAGLAGAIIGGAIATNAAKSQAVAQKNAPVAIFLSGLNSVDWARVIVDRLNHSIGELAAVSGGEFSAGLGSTHMKLRPKLEMSSNYEGLELHTLVEVFDLTGRQVYSNYFHVLSPSLHENEMNLKDVNMFTVSESVKPVLDLADQTIKLAYADIANELVAAKVPKSIRFTNHMGKYFEMGRVVSDQDGYITFKTLRGEVKHYPKNNEESHPN